MNHGAVGSMSSQQLPSLERNNASIQMGVPVAPSAADGLSALEVVRLQPYFRAGAGAHGWHRTLLGLTLGWPWFDRATLMLLRRVVFPLSRLWAAARVSGQSAETFAATVPLQLKAGDSQRLERVFVRLEEAEVAARAADAAWEAAFFGPAETSLTHRAAAEAFRLDARQALNRTRGLFVSFLTRDVPRVRLATRTPDQAAAQYGDAVRNGLAARVAPPVQMPVVTVSRPVAGTAGRDYWLRFQSPAQSGGLVTARVHEPLGITDPPTIILGHGIGVEFDHWRGLVDETDQLVGLGFRVIRPEAPDHGRRSRPNAFGGETIIGTFPTGALDAFSAALQEWAVLADWARQTSRGALAFGGTSLGAQMAQLAAVTAQRWPERLRPQALLLITHCGSLKEAVLHGALPEIFGNAPDVFAKGWTEDSVTPYLALLDPGPTAPLPRERIVSVLGRYDRITPFASGQALIESWALPESNVFILPRGHFSVPMTLIRNDAPLKRFQAIVAGL